MWPCIFYKFAKIIWLTDFSLIKGSLNEQHRSSCGHAQVAILFYSYIYGIISPNKSIFQQPYYSIQNFSLHSKNLKGESSMKKP